jgi:hypothetical protein
LNELFRVVRSRPSSEVRLKKGMNSTHMRISCNLIWGFFLMSVNRLI